MWSKEIPSATYPRGGRGLEVDSGFGIRLGLASDLTPAPIDQKVSVPKGVKGPGYEASTVVYLEWVFCDR